MMTDNIAVPLDPFFECYPGDTEYFILSGATGVSPNNKAGM